MQHPINPKPISMSALGHSFVSPQRVVCIGSHPGPPLEISVRPLPHFYGRKLTIRFRPKVAGPHCASWRSFPALLYIHQKRTSLVHRAQEALRQEQSPPNCWTTGDSGVTSTPALKLRLLQSKRRFPAQRTPRAISCRRSSVQSRPWLPGCRGSRQAAAATRAAAARASPAGR